MCLETKQKYRNIKMIIQGKFDKEEQQYEIVFIFSSKEEVINFLIKLDQLDLV